LLSDPAVRGSAIRALASFSDAEVPELILASYTKYSTSEKADAINTLAARREYAPKLVAALERGVVDRADLDAFTVRQLHALGDAGLSARLNKAWGLIRSPSKERTALIAGYKKRLGPDVMKSADASRGRAVFQKNCAVCHVLFDAGGRIGPELTGGQRANLEYVLENVVDPSAVVARDYQVTVIATRDGRILNGIIRREDEHALSLQTPNELITLSKEDVEKRKPSSLSLMPEGILDKLRDDEIRDLVGYLASPTQVPLPAEPSGGTSPK
jgi:putative heme-binding domain-containing protein